MISKRSSYGRVAASSSTSTAASLSTSSSNLSPSPLSSLPSHKLNGYEIKRPSKPSLFVPRSINPDTFTPRVDIIWQVSNSKDTYVGDRSLSITQLPLFIKVNVDRLRPHMKGSPGIHPILAACLFHGVVGIFNQDEVRELIHLKNRFDSAPGNLPGLISATLANFLSRFKVDTPPGERFNFFLPANHHALLSRIGRDLGVNIQTLGVLAIIHTLSTQLLTNQDDRKEMERVLKSFSESCEVRGRGARALMKEFQIPEIEEKMIEELEDC